MTTVAPRALVQRLGNLEHLSDAEQQALLHLIDSLLANTHMRAGLGSAS
jgi:hypothetical protein